MTDRIARILPIAALCIVLAVALVACGGGGGGKPQHTPPGDEGRVMPDPRRPNPDADYYRSIAVGRNAAGNSYVVGMPIGLGHSSRSAALDAAMALCRSRGGNNCQEVLWFKNGCGAIAIDGDGNEAGVGWSVNSGDYEAKAIAACRAAGGSGSSGPAGCSIATDEEDGSEFSNCTLLGGSPAAGEASAIAPLKDVYLAFAHGVRASFGPVCGIGGIGGGSITRGCAFTWSWDTGDSASAAESAAQARCRMKLGGASCTTAIPAGINECQAMAVAECPLGSSTTCRPAFAGGRGATVAAATASAIQACEQNIATSVNIGAITTEQGRTMRGTCRVDYWYAGDPSYWCVGTSSGEDF